VTESEPKILCVDDETRVLDSLENHLGFEFDVHCAERGSDALQIVQSEGPFSAIVSDMRMPEMDGAEFLRKARAIAPDTTRILLTGYADVQSAVAAVNQGQIWRFLTKPCPKATLLETVSEACELFRLRRVEHDLLDRTVRGSIHALTEVLCAARPLAFGRAKRMASLVQHICAQCQIPHAWKYEIAALVSQVGCINIDDAILSKAYAGQSLNDDENAHYGAHIGLSAQIVADIPRLESVAEMIRSQDLRDGRRDSKKSLPADVALGADLLNLARLVDVATRSGESRSSVCERIQHKSWLPKAWIAAVAGYNPRPTGRVSLSVRARELKVGMVFEQDVLSSVGAVLITAGHEATALVIQRLRHAADAGSLREPISVAVDS